jgi:acetyl esterase
MNLDELRAGYVHRCRAAAGTPIPMRGVEDLAAPVPARLYTPPEADERMLVYLHGGRFISGGYETHDWLCRFLAAHSRWRVLLVDYRLAPEHLYPAALEDTLEAVRWAARHAPGIALAGDSAGGSLAAAAALSSKDRLEGLVLFYPMLDATCHLPSHEEFRTGPGPSSEDMRFGYDLYLPADVDRSEPSVSPLFTPHPESLPPTFLFTAGVDSLRDEGQAFAARLRTVHRVHLPEVMHGTLTLPAQHEAAVFVLGEAARWLRSR